MNVLDFIEGTTNNRNNLPQVMTLKRTMQSKYLFYLLARHYRQEVQKVPRFMQYTKQDASSHKAMMEEESVFGTKDLFVLEGYPIQFVEKLSLPKGSFVVSESDDGELEAPLYSYKERRGILWVLIRQLRLQHSLRHLLQLDWSRTRDYPEIERWLRKASVAGWTEEELGEHLTSADTDNVLAMFKRGDVVGSFEMRRRYGDNWFLRNLYNSIPQLARFRALRLLGQSDGQVGDAMSLSPMRVKELDETMRMIPNQDLVLLAHRLVEQDRVFLRRKALALDLLILKNPISVRRTSGYAAS